MQEKILKLKKIRILFVEDELDLIKIISDTLDKLKANFITANNGVQALEIFKNDKDIDLVVTDINMPIMNGLEFIEKIRETNKEFPIVIMSAHTETEYIKSAESLNVSKYLLKPFDFIKFIDLVYELNLK
jgi:YesN/AraC family two-component response regulator